MDWSRNNAQESERKTVIRGQSQAVERLLLIQLCMALAHVHGKIVIEMHTHGDRHEAINTATPQPFMEEGSKSLVHFEGIDPWMSACCAAPKKQDFSLVPFLQSDCTRSLSARRHIGKAFNSEVRRTALPAFYKVKCCPTRRSLQLLCNGAVLGPF
jgi:hypothetical protein